MIEKTKTAELEDELRTKLIVFMGEHKKTILLMSIESGIARPTLSNFLNEKTGTSLLSLARIQLYMENYKPKESLR